VYTHIIHESSAGVNMYVCIWWYKLV